MFNCLGVSAPIVRRYGGFAAICIAAVLWRHPASAALSQSCQDLRAQIANIEKQVPSGAALSVELAIRKVYVEDCLRHPSDGSTPGSSASDPWFNADGNPASGPQPDGDGVFQTTPEIAGYCRGSSDPGLCALMLNLGEGEILAEGGNPQDPDDWTKPVRAIDPADELPPLQLSAAGQTFSVDDACLGGLAGILFSNAGSDGLRSRLAINLATPQCAGELNAISAALGTVQDAIAQWRATALNDRTPPTGANGRALQPGFLEMCRQAFNDQNTCRARQSDMRSIDSDSHGLGSEGQAGAFGDCANLYGSVVAMCRQSGVQFPRSPLKQARQPPRPTPRAADKKLPPKPETAQGSAPPMSNKCRGLVQNLVTAAHANDGPGAKASYDALQQAGGCGVLDKVDHAPPATATGPSVDDPRFVSRGATPLSDQVVGGCDAAPDECAERVRQLRAGVSPEAIAALYTNAINVGLELGNLMGNAMLSGMPTTGAALRGGGTNMNSIGNKPVRSTYGQGSPTRPAPAPIHQGCVECNVGTAQ